MTIQAEQGSTTTTTSVDDVSSRRREGLRGHSLAEHLAGWAELHPDDVAWTFVDYLADEDGIAHTDTWAELDAKVDGLAARLLEVTSPGDRVAVMTPQSTGFAVAFLAAQRVGAIPVPLFAPGLPGHEDRLVSVLEDCTPSVLVSAGLGTLASQQLVEEHGFTFVAAVVDVDDHRSTEVTPVVATPSDIAYLQYTSGSTSVPRGVVIRHSNVHANAEQMLKAYEVEHGGPDDVTAVSWLPLFHDMGFMLAFAGPMTARVPSVVFDPIAFLIKPSRWLRLLSDYPDAVSAGPNFAFGYCASRVGPEERDWLQLDAVRGIGNGAEPIHAETVDAFHDAFEECGLQRDVHRISYGLAEAVVFVSVTPYGSEPRRVNLDREALGGGRAVETDGEGAIFLSCGKPIGQDVAIVDPTTDERLPDGHVGEIRSAGPNICTHYWGREDDAAEVFATSVVGDDRAWLKTGDLGVMIDGEVYVTGRIKDLIVVGGRNHYPHDIELSTEQAHPAIRRRNVAAFAVDPRMITDEAERPAGDTEVLVVVAERAKGHEGVDPAEVAAAVRAQLGSRHGVALHELVLVDPGAVPRTSSGKVARSASRDLYLAKTWS